MRAVVAGALVLGLVGLVLWLTAERGPEAGAVPKAPDRGEHAAAPATPTGTPETTPLIRPRVFEDDSTRPADADSGSASISGRVEVDGAQPKDPVRLTLFQPGPPIPVKPSATTGPGGAFEFARLRTSSEWNVSPEMGYVLVDVVRDGRPVIVLAAPSSGILVKLERVPVIRGRIVAGSPPAPVRGATCKIDLQWANGGFTVNLSAGPDGRFSYALAHTFDSINGKLIKLVVTAQAPRNVAEKTVVVDPVPTADHDLGDIELSGLRVVRYLATDSSGAPVAGAFARLGKQDGDVDPDSRSGADGRGAVTVAPEDRSFFLGALKHSVVQVPIPAPTPDEIAVTLPANAGIQVKVLTDPSTSPTLLRLRVSSKGPDMLEPPAPGNEPAAARVVFDPVLAKGLIARNDPIYIAAGATQDWNSSFGSAGGIANFDLKQDGVVIFAGLKPGVPIEVAAIDKFGAVLTAVPDVTLLPAEWKTVELRVARSARVLRGRVLDPDGRAVPEAWLIADPDRKNEALRSPGYAGNDRVTGKTDAEGRFELAGLFADSIDLVIRKPGFAPSVSRGFPMSRAVSEVVFTLERGTNVVVKLVDAQGGPVRKAAVDALASTGLSARGDERQPGEYLFRDFQIGASVEISVWWLEHTFKKAITVTPDHIEIITLPGTGTVVIDLRQIEPPPPSSYYTLHLWALDQEPPGARAQNILPPQHGAEPTREVELTPIVVGDYRVTLSAPGGPASKPQTLTVHAGETVRVTLEKP